MKLVMVDTYSKLYRWIPIDICLKNLIRGLSYGQVSSYKDNTEFSVKSKEITVEELMIFYKKNNPLFFNNLGSFPAGKLRSLVYYLNASNMHGEEIRNLLCNYFYTCCFTDKYSKNFNWSDRSKKPMVCLVVNAKILESEYREAVRPIQYLPQRPEVGLEDDFKDIARVTMFSKLKKFEQESEVRVTLCKTLLDYPEMAVLYENEDNAYIYEKLLHEYLEAIFIPKETQGMENVQETILKIKQELNASRNIEEQVSLCKKIKQLTARKKCRGA